MPNDPYKTRQTLIQRVKDQYNDIAWEEFASVYKKYIYAVIRKMNIAEHDAEDIQQKVMMKLWKILPELNHEEIRRFRTYLSTITKNTVIDFVVAEKRKVAREDKAASDASLHYLDSINLPDVELIAEQEWESYISNLALKHISEQFTNKAIQVFKMSLKNSPVEEIASQLELATKTVYNLRLKVKNSLIKEIGRLRSEYE